jgi:glycine betaine/choline ABC-type transport system substrate-binding protein
MRSYRSYALGAALLSLALLAGACGSGGGGETPGGETKTLASTFVFGAPPDCPTNELCQKGLKSVYGIEFKQVRPLDFGGPLTVSALKSGAIQVGELFSTSVYDPDFVVLEDDKHLQAADNIVPLIREEVSTPEIEELLNGVSAALTTDGLLALNKRIDVDHEDPADVAKDFLTQANLLSTPSDTGNGTKLTVGVSSSGFGEQALLAEMYAQVLENAGYEIKRQLDLESRKVSDPALFSGEIDIKPEYLASEAVLNDPKAKVTGDPENNHTILAEILSAKGVKVLDFSPAADQNVFVVTKETATKYNLTKLSDLAKPAP